MSPSISVALLLLSTTFIESRKFLEAQSEEVEVFFFQLENYLRERAEDHNEEIVQDGVPQGFCNTCISVVPKVKKMLGSNYSKNQIGLLLKKACNRIKSRPIRFSCKRIISKFEDKLINAIANHRSPRTICVEVNLCKRNAPA